MISLNLKLGFWTTLTIIVLSYFLICFFHEDNYVGMLSSPPQKIGVKRSYPLSLPIVDYYHNQAKTAIIFPIGRPFPRDFNVKFLLNNNEIILPILSGPCGGHWANLSLEIISSDSVFSVSRTLSQGCTTLSRDDTLNRSIWTEPSPFIDSDKTIIQQVASNLTDAKNSINEKAQILNTFVHDFIDYSNDPVLPENASQTYFARKGRCRHFARLFVALCRSIDIPARTISGRLLTDSSPRADLHLWAEFYDENHYWIPVDPTHDYFNFSNTRFLDLSFAIYQHPFNATEAFFSNASTLIEGYGQIKITAVSFSIQNMVDLLIFFSLFFILSAILSYIPVEITFIVNKIGKKNENKEL